MLQEANMLREFEERRRSVCREVVELRQRRDALKEDLARLSEEFKSSNSQLDDATAHLKAFNTRFAVTERRLKEARAKTSLLRRRRSEVSQETLSLLEEFAALEAELHQLEKKRETLGKGTVSLKAAIKETMEAMEAITHKKRQILVEIGEYELEREELVREIAHMLSIADSQRTRIESDLVDLTLPLVDHIAERNSIKNALNERAPSMAALRERVTDLEQRRRSIEDAKALESRRTFLKSTVSEVKREIESIEGRIDELQKLRSSKQKELQALSEGNAQRAKSISDIEDKVGLYDELISKIEKDEARLADLLRSNEMSVAQVEGLFTDSIGLESEHRQLEEKLKAMVHLAGRKMNDE